MQNSNAANCEPERPLSLLRRLFSAHLELVERYATTIAHGESPDAETIHDFRIALRRAETVLTQFRELIAKPERKWFVSQLKKLRKASNPLRDADIFLEHLETYHADGPFNGLKEKVLNGHQTAMNDVQPSCVRWLDTQQRIEHRARIIDRIDRSLQKMNIESDGEPQNELSEWIHAGLAKMGRTIFRAKLNWKGWTTLHDRRIAAKRLRYALELYREFLPQEEYDAMYRRLKSLQNRLGTMNDEVTIIAQLEEWSDSSLTPVGDKEEIARLREREKSSLKAHLEEFKEWWTSSRRRKWKNRWKDLLNKVKKTT